MSKTKIENSKAPNPIRDFEAAIDALRRGDVIVFPTETLYGLGADALNSEGWKKSFNSKAVTLRIPFLCSWPTRRCFAILLVRFRPSRRN